ncbi:integrase [Klebsiella pneumoniae]|nr:integrase [Klebsiella pneumoniae]OVX47333.1 integrase [Klebsiella pneumoniae]OVX98084.1 integrase [Klebsiella pneumoniae]
MKEVTQMAFEQILAEYFFARLLKPAPQSSYRTAVNHFISTLSSKSIENVV